MPEKEWVPIAGHQVYGGSRFSLARRGEEYAVIEYEYSQQVATYPFPSKDAAALFYAEMFFDALAGGVEVQRFELR